MNKGEIISYNTLTDRIQMMFDNNHEVIKSIDIIAFNDEQGEINKNKFEEGNLTDQLNNYLVEKKNEFYSIACNELKLLLNIVYIVGAHENKKIIILKDQELGNKTFKFKVLVSFS